VQSPLDSALVRVTSTDDWVVLMRSLHSPTYSVLVHTTMQSPTDSARISQLPTWHKHHCNSSSESVWVRAFMLGPSDSAWTSWAIFHLVDYSAQAQRQCLCRAFPFEFWGLSNIFQQEGGYFPQKSPIKIFSERWLCRSLKNLTDQIFQTLFDKFLLCWWLRYSLNKPFWPLVSPLPAVCGVG